MRSSYIPKIGEIYYFLTEKYGIRSTVYCGTKEDVTLVSNGLAYRSGEEAKKHKGKPCN